MIARNQYIQTRPAPGDFVQLTQKWPAQYFACSGLRGVVVRVTGDGCMDVVMTDDPQVEINSDWSDVNVSEAHIERVLCRADYHKTQYVYQHLWRVHDEDRTQAMLAAERAKAGAAP